MNKFFHTILFTLAICTTTSVFAEKIYISSRDVMVAENGIIVNVNGFAEKVDAIYFDSEGIYIEPINMWICSKGHIIWGTKVCPYCHEEQIN